MPRYDYHCPACESTFEVSRRFADADAPLDCPRCGGPVTRKPFDIQAIEHFGWRRRAGTDRLGHGHWHPPGTPDHRH
jgi:putative FmdB family regulatory protein